MDLSYQNCLVTAVQGCTPAAESCLIQQLLIKKKINVKCLFIRFNKRCGNAIYYNDLGHHSGILENLPSIGISNEGLCIKTGPLNLQVDHRIKIVFPPRSQTIVPERIGTPSDGILHQSE